MNINWLKPHSDLIEKALAEERLAHAYLISGPAGVGKRALVHDLLPKLLGLESVDSRDGWPELPDFYPVALPDDKATLGIDPVRALTESLSQTRFRAPRKVAVIDPVNALTLAAANALLKTLEEPPGETVLMLVADRLSALPATILSRCVQLRCQTPPLAVGRDWLASIGATGSLDAALWLARGAPLRAQALLNGDQLAVAEGCLRDLGHLLPGRGDPVQVAAAWLKLDIDTVWLCLSRACEELIRQCRGLAAEPSPFGEISANVRASVDLPNLFCYQDRLNRLRTRPTNSFNLQLTLETLLLAWPQRFRRPAIAGPLLAYPGAA